MGDVAKRYGFMPSLLVGRMLVRPCVEAKPGEPHEVRRGVAPWGTDAPPFGGLLDGVLEVDLLHVTTSAIAVAKVHGQA